MLPYKIDDDLELCPLEAHHARVLLNVVNRDRDYLRQWQNWPDQIRTLGDMQTLIYRSQQKTACNDGFDAVILHHGKPVGKIGLAFIDWRGRYTEIGYWLAQSSQGHGLMTRSCRALVSYALLTMRLERVQIRCAAGNVRSSAIPERLGFKFEGKMPHKIWLHNEKHDEHLYTMTREQWKCHMIYHITTRQEWEAARAAGTYRAPSLDSQGFIHFSQVDQVLKVADAIYTGQQNLVLLTVDPERLHAALKYEPPDTTIPAEHYEGELFPHLYGALNPDAVIRVVDFPPNSDGSFSLPDEL